MAAPNLNKPYVYDLLGRLNVSFGRVNRNLAELENTGAFSPKTMKTIGSLSRALQADANHHLLEALQEIETRELGEIQQSPQHKKIPLINSKRAT
ncbi:MAG TPA: hypothetical protein VNW97_13475 [Candidatus Saccharimonadales bacterium]|jgi:hypothetical protein|nr:hypothetical protein [Candidatus Saccharimonadales bacterium]